MGSDPGQTRCLIHTSLVQDRASLQSVNSTGEQEVAVTAPFIVKSVSRIHPGKAEAYQPVAAEICRIAEEKEPRLLGFHIYVSEDHSSEVVVQIHPDAESMQHHLQVLGEKVRETFAYADFESLEIYGQPNDALMEWIPRVTEGIPVHPPLRALGRLHPS
jgi:quinol monooxygenase YgiN